MCQVNLRHGARPVEVMHRCWLRDSIIFGYVEWLGASKELTRMPLILIRSDQDTIRAGHPWMASSTQSQPASALTRMGPIQTQSGTPPPVETCPPAQVDPPLDPPAHLLEYPLRRACFADCMSIRQAALSSRRTGTGYVGSRAGQVTCAIMELPQTHTRRVNIPKRPVE